MSKKQRFLAGHKFIFDSIFTYQYQNSSVNLGFIVEYQTPNDATYHSKILMIKTDSFTCEKYLFQNNVVETVAFENLTFEPLTESINE